MASKKSQSETLRNIISGGAEKLTTTPPAREGEYLPGGPEGGSISTQGVGLRKTELDELRALANSLGITINALMRSIIRWALIEIHAGRLDPRKVVKMKTETKTKVSY